MIGGTSSYDFTLVVMDIQPFSPVEVARSIVSPLLFGAAALILVFARPRWHGPWWLLVGAVLLLATEAALYVRWQGDSLATWLTLKIVEASAFVLVGVGIFLIALRARKA